MTGLLFELQPSNFGKLEFFNNNIVDKNVMKHIFSYRQSSMRMDEEQKTKAIARETLANADRRAHTLQNALEESRTMLEQADRARRAAEQELQVR